MTSSEAARANQLNRYLDALVRGEPEPASALDPIVVLGVERVHALSNARVGPRLSVDEATQIWVNLLRQHAEESAP